MATIIFKATEECNSRCVYCDVVRKQASGPKRMELATLDLFFSRVGEFLRDRPEEHVQLIWHGGEPLLLGKDYFLRALEYQEKHCGADADRIHHSMQSNLTLLTPEHVAALKALGLTSVGTSYDPEPDVRGIGKRRDSTAYATKFHNAVRLLEDNGLGWGIIYVVTKKSLRDPEKVFNFLTNFANNGAFMINPVLDYGGKLDDIRITPEEYAAFLTAILPLWWRGHRREMDGLAKIEPLHSLTAALLGKEPLLLCSSSGDCGDTHVEITTDGRASQCGRSSDWHMLDYGYIHDRSFAEMFADPQRETLARRNVVLQEGECRDCRWWEVCHGGCPLDGAAEDGNFFHKTNWCQARKLFLERTLEPFLREMVPEMMSKGETAPSSVQPTSTVRRQGINPVSEDPATPVWVNPVGGLGDALMVSAVLKQVAERFPNRRYNLVERSKYNDIFGNHPAIAAVGNPPPGARFASTAYWCQETFANPGVRPFQVLADMFGLDGPVQEIPYVPWDMEDDPLLVSRIPWRSVNVLICSGSDSPRKRMPIAKWEALVDLLRAEDCCVVQVGLDRDGYVRGAFDLLGLTTPHQLVSLVGRFDVVVTSDSFLMHAAHLRAVPAVVLWGPTRPSVYGYHDQTHLDSDVVCKDRTCCVGPDQLLPYQRNCPRGDDHCMNAFVPEAIRDAILATTVSSLPLAHGER